MISSTIVMEVPVMRPAFRLAVVLLLTAGVPPAQAQEEPLAGRDVGGRVARLEQETHRAFQHGDFQRIADLVPQLQRLEDELEAALVRPRPGHPPRPDLRGLLDLVRHLRAEASRIVAGSRWRSVPPPWIRQPPDASRITIRPASDGTATITGTAGAAGDTRARLVRAVNLMTADEAVAKVMPDGSFALRLVAPPGSSVQIATALSGDLPAPIPDEVRGRFESGESLDLDEAVGPLREMIAGDRTTSPGVILPVRARQAGTVGFISKVGRGRWVFGPARPSRRRFEPGDRAELHVAMTVRFESEGAARRATANRPTVDPILVPMFDTRGRQRGGGRLLATHVLTPTGLPIETHGEMVAHRRDDGRMVIEPGGSGLGLPYEPLDRGMWQRRGRTATITQRIRFEIPANVPAGIYALRGHIWPGAGEGLLEGAPQGGADFGPVTIGSVAEPRLACMLLGSAGTGGSRGAIAREDQGFYSVAPHNVFQPARLVIPRDDVHAGKPHPYPLDPYLPLVSLTDRPGEMRTWPPRIRFDATASRLTVTVTAPNGTVTRLGPAPLACGQNDLSSAGPDRTVLDRLVAPRGPAYGNPSLADIYHLSGGPAFEHAFAEYGRHVVTLDGHVSDVAGHRYRIAGTYDVYVAKPLDISVFPEPGTPLEVGQAVLPQVRVLPAMPAEVEIRFRHLPGSEAERAVERVVSGKANRWGVFVPDAATKAVVFDEPGEYVCDVTVKHVDAAGTWWVACRRGASVVATPNSTVVTHGERGNRAPTQRWRARWFIARDAQFITGMPPGVHDMAHTCYPYEPGDVAWLGHRDPDSLFPNVTLEDPAGTIAGLIEGRWPGVRHGAGRAGLYPDWLRPEDRLAIGELPLVCSSLSGLSPSMAPDRVDQWGYFYTTSWRPGVSVRSHVGEDLVPAAYWFFDDPYGYQFGVGPQGDLPADYKMNYAGSVFRDTASGVAHYGAYASMLVIIDGDRDPIGRRVLPPFDGLLPDSPPSGPLLEVGGKRYDVFLTFGAVSPGAVLTVGDPLAVSGVVWPPVSGFVRGTLISPSGRKTPFKTAASAMGVFDVAGPTASEPGIWRVTVEGVCNGRTSAGRIADLVPEDKWPRGSGVGLQDNTFAVPVVPAKAAPIAFDLPAGTRARPPDPLVIRGHLPPSAEAKTVRALVALPTGVMDEVDLPATDGAFTYVYDPAALARDFPNIDVTLPGPDPIVRYPAWYDTVTFTFWTGDGPAVRAGTVLLQGEDVYAAAMTGREPPGQAPPVLVRASSKPPLPPLAASPSRSAPAASGAAATRSSLLALSPDGAALFAGHPHSGEVVRLALGDGPPEVAATARPGGHVRSVAPSADGRRLYVAVSDRHEVVALEAATLRVGSRWRLSAEPWAALPSRDGTAVFVADYDGNRVLRLGAADGRTKASSPPIYRPSALALSANGDVYAVSFRTGEVVVMDANLRVRRRLPAGEQLNQCRALTLGPDGTAYAPQTRSDTRLGGRMFDRTVFPAVAVAGPGDGRVRIGLFPDLLTVPPHRPCEAALGDGTLYLAHAGSDDVVAIDLATSFPRWHAKAVGLEPGGLRLDAARGRLYVLTVTGQEIVTLRARDGAAQSRVRFAHDPTPPPVARGRYLFGTATDSRLTKDRWISCAACHPDGAGQDGRQWDLGEGPLDTHSLRGCTASPPLHYTGHLDEIQDTADFTRHVMAGRWFVPQERMNPSLGRSNAGLNRDLDALAAYIESLSPKRPPPPLPELADTIRRGKAIFESDATGCAVCHPAPRYTDSGRRDAEGHFLRHDVGMWKPGEAETLRRLDTPSLLGLRQSEPYLHDGRAHTLEEVFTRYNPKDRHGTTSHLSAEDVAALATFLRYLDPGPATASPRPVHPVVPPAEYDRGDGRRHPPSPGEAPPPPLPAEPQEPDHEPGQDPQPLIVSDVDTGDASPEVRGPGVPEIGRPAGYPDRPGNRPAGGQQMTVPPH